MLLNKEFTRFHRKRAHQILRGINIEVKAVSSPQSWAQRLRLKSTLASVLAGREE